MFHEEREIIPDNFFVRPLGPAANTGWRSAPPVFRGPQEGTLHQYLQCLLRLTSRKVVSKILNITLLQQVIHCGGVRHFSKIYLFGTFNGVHYF